MEWQAECNCGQLRATCAGEPDRVSVCHCTNCKRRTGSAFAWNASFPAEAVTTAGERHSFARATDTGRPNVYHFCPTCGSTVFYDVEMRPGMISCRRGHSPLPTFLRLRCRYSNSGTCLGARSTPDRTRLPTNERPARRPRLFH